MDVATSIVLRYRQEATESGQPARYGLTGAWKSPMPANVWPEHPMHHPKHLANAGNVEWNVESGTIDH